MKRPATTARLPAIALAKEEACFDDRMTANAWRSRRMPSRLIGPICLICPIHFVICHRARPVSCFIMSQIGTEGLELPSFTERHVGPSSDDLDGMLKELGFDTLDSLTDSAVPERIRFRES